VQGWERLGLGIEGAEHIARPLVEDTLDHDPSNLATLSLALAPFRLVEVGL